MAYDQHISAGMHIGTRQQAKHMRRFVYKTREDGLAVINLQKIEERVKIAAKALSKYKNIMVVSRKAIGWKAAQRFASLVNGKAVVGRFLPGTVTNPNFRGYIEPDVVIVTDPLVDKQAVTEAVKMRIPIFSLVNTSNETNLLDFIIPMNNKGRKAVATIYWLLAGEILKNKGVTEYDAKVEEFESTAEEREMQPEPEKRRDNERPRGRGREKRRR